LDLRTTLNGGSKQRNKTFLEFSFFLSQAIV